MAIINNQKGWQPKCLFKTRLLKFILMFLLDIRSTGGPSGGVWKIHRCIITPWDPGLQWTVLSLILLGSGSRTVGSWVPFTLRSFNHSQRLVEGGAGLLGNLMLNLVPDGNLKTLGGTSVKSDIELQIFKVLSGEMNSLSFMDLFTSVLTFFSFCCWTTWAFLGAMILPS